MTEEETDKKKPAALILGGTSGLGLALARQLWRRGWQTTVVGRTIYHYEVGLDRYYLHCDLDSTTEVSNLVKMLGRQPSGPDAFLWVGGMFLRGPFVASSAYDNQRLLDVNFTNSLPLVKSIWNRFQNTEQPTWLAAISSMTATSACPDQAIYAASMAARAHFTRCLGRENRQHCCRVALYTPVDMQTNLYNASGRPAGYDQFLDPCRVAIRILDHLFQPIWGPHNFTFEVPLSRQSFAAEPFTALPTSVFDRLSCE